MSIERISVLETHRENDALRLRTIEQKLDLVHNDLGEIKATLTKQRGFIAGMMAVIVPLWSLVVAAGVALWQRFTQ